MTTAIVLSDSVFDPYIDFLADNTPQSILEALSPSFADFLDDVTTILNDDTATGLISINDGILSGTVSTLTSTTNILIDTTDFLTTLIDQAATVSGTLTYLDGIFNTDLTIDGTAYTLTDTDLSGFFETTINSFFMEAEVTIPFNQGIIAIDYTNFLGNFVGTIDLSNGQLAVDLDTPYGDLVATLPFPNGVEIAFEAFGGSGVVDFAQGDVLLSLFGFDLAIPIDTLAGELILNNGIANLNAITPFGAVSTELDLGPIATELIEFFTEDIAADITVTNGLVTGLITTPFGEISPDFSLIDLATDVFDLATETSGTLSLDNGAVTVDLVTPSGVIDTTLTGTEISAFLATPLLDLV